MTPFALIEPATLDEVIGLMDTGDPTVRSVAGGTALMLMMKAGVFQPSKLISLRRLNGALTGITIGDNDDLLIGAMTPLAEIEQSAEVAQRTPLMKSIMPRLSNARVRNVATVGGALAHGDPHMDLPPVAIALGGFVRIAGSRGVRELAVEDLLTGYYETALGPGELITALRVPAQRKTYAAYHKVTAASADDWPALGLAVALTADGNKIKSARVVVSAATLKATRLNKVERMLIGAPVDDKLLRDAGEAARAEAEIIADFRGSATYKRELLRVYFGGAVRDALSANGAAR